MYIAHMYIHTQLYLFLHLSTYIKSCVFIQIPPIPIQLHKIYSSLPRFHLCKSVLWQREAWLPLLSVYLLICSIPLYVTNLWPCQPRTLQLCGDHMGHCTERERQCFRFWLCDSIASCQPFDALKNCLPFPQHFFFFLKKFYWSIVDLQCCVNFCCTANWFSSLHIFSCFQQDCCPE